MKKTLIIVFSLALIIGLTGCGGKKQDVDGKKQVVCTITVNGVSINYTHKNELIANIDDDGKVTNVSNILIWDIPEGTTTEDLQPGLTLADVWCENNKRDYPNAKVECSDTRITVDRGFDGDYSSETKDSFIEKAELVGYTCE